MNTTMWKNVRTGYPDYIYDCIRGVTWVPVNESPPITTPSRLAELSDDAARILGENGLARFREFSSYSEGWDFGHGVALSPGSIASLELFLASYDRFTRRPSLFFTRPGYLALGWEDADDNSIEIEFAPDHFVVYLASTDEEIVVDREDLPSLLAKLP
jgi:hypothetical protein